MGRESTKSRVSASGKISDLALNGCMLARSKLVYLTYEAIWSIFVSFAH